MSMIELFCENSYQILAVNYFWKNAASGGVRQGPKCVSFGVKSSHPQLPQGASFEVFVLYMTNSILGKSWKYMQ